jgi:hypothetical protein
VLNQRRDKEQPANCYLLEAFNDDPFGAFCESDLSSPAPKSPENPPYELIGRLLGIFGYKRKRKLLQRSGVPALTEILDRTRQSVQSNPTSRRLEVGVHRLRGERKLVFELDDHDSRVTVT